VNFISPIASPGEKLAAGREIRARQVAKQAAIASEFQNWRSTPSRTECNETALTHEPVLLKNWDLSPIDQQSFDPVEPPGRPLPPTAPVNTVLPSIVSLGGLHVGDTLAGQAGVWTGVPTPTLARQWFRDDSAIPGETSPGYVLDDADLGTFISIDVIGTNAAGSSTATSDEVGPIVEAAP
jgi:hypothetical protein